MRNTAQSPGKYGETWGKRKTRKTRGETWRKYAPDQCHTPEPSPPLPRADFCRGLAAAPRKVSIFASKIDFFPCGKSVFTKKKKTSECVQMTPPKKNIFSEKKRRRRAH